MPIFGFYLRFFFVKPKLVIIKEAHGKINLSSRANLGDCVRSSGGLLLFWTENIDISIQSYSKGHMDCIVKHWPKKWRFT